MERFYLKLPTLFDKNSIINLLDEYIKYNSDFNGLGPLINYLYGKSIEEAIKECSLVQNKAYAKSINRLPSKTYLITRENDNKIIGAINIRFNNSKEEILFRGNIGYSIRPTERNKGYSKINLYLGLIKAQELGLENVIIVCENNNTASNKTITALGGKLEKSAIDPTDGLLTNIYSINIKESLDKYQNIYLSYMKEGNK